MTPVCGHKWRCTGVFFEVCLHPASEIFSLLTFIIKDDTISMIFSMLNNSIQIIYKENDLYPI